MKKSILEGKRLLAVDDEPDILETLQEHLEDIEGLVLDQASSYETGYHLLRSWTYDLVVLDIMGVRGFDLLNAAVALGYPTVMLTAHALTPEALRKSVELGARAFLPKEKMSDVVSFFEDVLSSTHQRGWQIVFDRLGEFFSRAFGPEWQKDEKAFREAIDSGKFPPKPVILKK